MPIVVQHASLEDLEALYEIEKGCFTEEAFSKEQIAHFLTVSDVINLVAQVDGETARFILGLTEHHRKSFVGHVYTIDVASKYRRMGVGLKLLEAIEEDFRKRRAEACFRSPLQQLSRIRTLPKKRLHRTREVRQLRARKRKPWNLT